MAGSRQSSEQVREQARAGMTKFASAQPAFGRPNIASISRRTLTACALGSKATSCPPERLALGDVALELDVVRQAERQVALAQRHIGRRLLAPHREAALAVEHLALLQRALGGGRHVRVEAHRRSRRLLAQRRRRPRKCRAPARSCAWAGRARRTCRSCPAGSCTRRSTGPRRRCRSRPPRRCPSPGGAARPCRRDRARRRPRSRPSSPARRPRLFGLHTSASSKREAGGKPRPFVCGTSPVALHTAVISMPDLVPSMNELNIFGLMWLRSLIFRYCVEDLPHRIRAWSGDRSGGSACPCRPRRP